VTEYEGIPELVEAINLQHSGYVQKRRGERLRLSDVLAAPVKQPACSERSSSMATRTCNYEPSLYAGQVHLAYDRKPTDASLR
jgi:hypothetical protein